MRAASVLVNRGWRWAFWFAMLLAVTVALRPERADLRQVNVLLPYLLIVLGASAGGGRALGLALALAAFLLDNYYFQPPYDEITVRTLADWIVLLSFLATSLVATELLARARNEAREASRRTEEARRLARLGSETLRYADPVQSLRVIESLVRSTLGAGWCRVVAWREGQGLELGREDGTPALSHDALARVCESRRAIAHDAAGRALTVAPGREDAFDEEALGGTSALALPLALDQEVLGVLALGAPRPLALDAAQSRFLTALAYYAALALERRRLIDAAAAAETLREANRMKDMVLASVSHDLRTPLATIKALAQSAAIDGTLPAAEIEAQADLLSRFVGDVLDLSRLRGGAVRLDPTINTADDLAGVVARQMRGIVRDRRLVVELDLDAPTLLGRFDLAHTARILANLVENALHVTPPEGEVTLAARRVDGWLEIAVSDRGPGIPMGLRDRVFEPFFRTDTAATPGRAGLGLAISRQLATLQHGTLEYEDRPGGGARFVLRLPAVDVDDAELDAAAAPSL